MTVTEPVVLAADIGGTSTKVVIATAGGEIVSFASGDGGNINSSPRALSSIAATLASATMSGQDIAAAHIGAAGAGPASLATVSDALESMWDSPGPLRVSDDLHTAFAASSPGGTGVLLLSGTGAVSAAFVDLEMVGRTDGLGWLLGDLGSATWIGIEALKATAAALDGRGPETVLTNLVPEVLAGQVTPADVADPRQRLISQTYRLEPRQYGMLAPVVVAHPADPVCSSILARARESLVSSARRAAGHVSTGDLVLTGGLLEPGGPLRASVQADLVACRDLAHLTVVGEDRARPPILGALVLAARAAGLHFDREAASRSLAEATPLK